MNKEQFAFNKIILEIFVDDLKAMKRIREVTTKFLDPPPRDVNAYAIKAEDFIDVVKHLGSLVKTSTVIRPTLNRTYFLAKRQLNSMQASGFTICSISKAIHCMNMMTRDFKETFN